MTLTTTTSIHPIQIEEEEEIKENNYRKQHNRRYTIIYTIFKLVFNSQSSKAFELAAAYLRVKKGTKERNNNNKSPNQLECYLGPSSIYRQKLNSPYTTR